MDSLSGLTARVRPLPPRNISTSAKARASDAGCNRMPFEQAVAFLWTARRIVAPQPRECAEPGCTKQRVLYGVTGGMQRVFCHQCEVTDASCARARPLLLQSGRRQTRASSPCQTGEDEEILESVRLRDEFCGDLGRYKQTFRAEHLHRQAADAAHAEKSARLAAAGRCAEPGCTKPQAFGMKYSNKTEFCRDHKKEGMVNLCSMTRCRQNGCTRAPSFGVQGTRIAEFCSHHSKEGMVNQVNKLCTFSGCNKVASHGWHTGRKHAVACAQHARAGMVNVVSGRPKRDRSTNTDVQCALTGASSSGSRKRSCRAGILQRASPVQPPQPEVVVKKEIEVVQQARESLKRERQRLLRNLRGM